MVSDLPKYSPYHSAFIYPNHGFVGSRNRYLCPAVINGWLCLLQIHLVKSIESCICLEFTFHFGPSEPGNFCSNDSQQSDSLRTFFPQLFSQVLESQGSCIQMVWRYVSHFTDIKVGLCLEWEKIWCTKVFTQEWDQKLNFCLILIEMDSSIMKYSSSECQEVSSSHVPIVFSDILTN